MADLPDALKYGCTHSTIRTNRFRLTPQGSDGATPNGSFRVRLPAKSLVRLSSLSASFISQITGLTYHAGTAWNNAIMASSFKWFKSIKFIVGGQVASGQLCNNYDQLYHALLVSSADNQYITSRYNEGYKELIVHADDVNYPALNPLATPAQGTSSISQYQILSDFLGLPRCNGGGGVIDTSLYNDVEIQFDLNDTSCLSVFAGATGSVAGTSFNLSQFRVEVDCIVSVSPMYVEMMSLRLQDPSPIRFPYQNFVSTIATNTGSVRLQVNTQSLDMFLCAPLRNNWNVMAGGVADRNQPLRYKWDTELGATDGAQASQQQYITNEATLRLGLQVGSDTYPKTQIDHALAVPDLTINTLFHGSLNSKNLFSTGVYNNSQVFNRSYGLSDNFVWINNFSLESEGWASKKLTGIDTSSQNIDIIVNSQNCGTNLFMTALITSQLVYSPDTASVSVVM